MLFTESVLPYVVFFLAALAFFYNLRFRALYIILLALFHDLQIVTIAYDHQIAGDKPETPTVMGLLLTSWTMGILMFVQTMLLVAYGHMYLSETFADSFRTSLSNADDPSKGELDEYMETTVFLQISNSSAILILSARTVGFFFTSIPAWQLVISTGIGQVLINLWCFNSPGKIIKQLEPYDIYMVWAYDILWLLILDCVKMTAGYIWEKFKPAEVDSNPALTSVQKRKKRVSNNLQGTTVAYAATHDPSSNACHAPVAVQEKKKRVSNNLGKGN